IHVRFFFSSRRRHTRFSRDWSSDVCSSDLYLREKSVVNDGLAKAFPNVRFEESPPELDHAGDIDYLGFVTEDKAFGIQIKPVTRSEERRVGKECRSRVRSSAGKNTSESTGA